MNILDYVDWRGDLSMSQAPFNEVDNLILAELAYIRVGDMLPFGERVTLAELYRLCAEKGINVPTQANDPWPMLEKAAGSRRFGSVRAGYFARETSVEKQFQFAAATFFLEDGTVYVAFSGTDDSIVGWREDFNFGYLTSTEGQTRARDYLRRVCRATDRKIRVGGHSKGGNLAVYAAAFCGDEYRDRIIAVYSNDGPGFNSDITFTPEYAMTLDKVKLIIPEFSVVGILLSNKADKKVVKSSADAMRQHNPYTWEVRGGAFVPADKQALSSLMMEETFARWFDSLDREQREGFISAVFDTLQATGAETFTQMRSRKAASYNSIVRAIRGMDPDMQRAFLDSVKKLIASGLDTLMEEARKAGGKLMSAITSEDQQGAEKAPGAGPGRPRS